MRQEKRGKKGSEGAVMAPWGSLRFLLDELRSLSAKKEILERNFTAGFIARSKSRRKWV